LHTELSVDLRTFARWPQFGQKRAASDPHKFSGWRRRSENHHDGQAERASAPSIMSMVFWMP
jgi:hypothetical protein